MSSATRKTGSKPRRVKHDRGVPTNVSEAPTPEQLQWLNENEKAIDYYNAFVEKHGLFGSN